MGFVAGFIAHLRWLPVSLTTFGRLKSCYRTVLSLTTLDRETTFR